MWPFNKKNVSKLDNERGIYKLYDKKKKLLYVGRSKVLKHRLQSYQEEDDWKAHPTKKALSGRIGFFSIINGHKNDKKFYAEEDRIIDRNKPAHNVNGKDGKPAWFLRKGNKKWG